MIAPLPIPTTLTPRHRLTAKALRQAYRLADYESLPPDHAIRVAARSGNLIATLDALRAYRKDLGPVGWLIDNLAERCDRLIFNGEARR